MCVAGEEEPGGSTAGGADPLPEIVVTASRLGIDLDVFQSIDWTEVGRLASLGALGGSIKGGWSGAISGALIAGAAAVESQPGVALQDLFVIKDDMIVIPGIQGGYYPMY